MKLQINYLRNLGENLGTWKFKNLEADLKKKKKLGE